MLGYVKLYCVFENQQSPAYHSLYLSIFLSIQEISVKDFSGTTLPRILKLGTILGHLMLYCVFENQLSQVYQSLYLSNFFSIQ